MTTPQTFKQQVDGLPAGQAQAQPMSSLVPAVREPQKAQAPVRRRRRWPWIAGALVGVVAAGLVYLQPWVPSPMSVAIEPLATAPVTRLLAVNGRIAALHSIDLRPLASGALTQVSVAEGDVVTTGQVLARIDTAAQDAVVRQAIAALDSALVAQEQADATYRRSLALGANVPTATLEADRRAAQRAMQEVARVSAMLEQAQVQLDRHTLYAPIAGTIVAMNAEPGEIVDTGMVLMTLADLGELIVETDVDEAYAGQIAVGQAAVMRLAGETGTRSGTVRSVAGRVDAATGGLAVTIGFDEPASAPIGLTVTANIVVDQQAAALTVPRTAIVTEGTGTAVFLLRDGVARHQPVTVIDWPAARLIVTEGLAPGDPVIVDAAGLADGQPVRTDTP